MKGGVFSAPGDYVHFKSQVPLHKIPIGTRQWRYYDFGPKNMPPLICLTGTAGTADVYYKQIMSLSMKGYRIISVDIPRVWNHREWIIAFEKFLDAIDVHHIHLYGTSLGGFLAQLFAQYRPRRVKSLVLSNTFLETRSFAASMPWAPVASWTPSFWLKRYVLTGIRDGPHEPFIADSVDFVVSQVETLSREDLASRLTLMADDASVGPLLLNDSFITIMDTNDYCATPQHLKDQVMDRYPGARQAQLKTGGDFPFLSRSDEVNLHLQLHLRRVGVEPRGSPVAHVLLKEGTSGSSSIVTSAIEETNTTPSDETEVTSDPANVETEVTIDSSKDERHDTRDPLRDEEEDPKRPPKDDENIISPPKGHDAESLDVTSSQRHITESELPLSLPPEGSTSQS
uniref:Maspardin n=1 Tax=Kalanchoe fedtschenkoi TaxID=63787 RepID=A0A7N1A8M6_KALFE